MWGREPWCKTNSHHVASWRSDSGPHQENHNSNNARSNFIITSSQNEAHKTWPTNLSTKRDKTKLWRPALCCEDLMSYIRISLVLMAALCCKESKTLCLSKKQPYAVSALCCRNVKTFCLSNGPTFAVLVKFRIACFRLLHYYRTTTRWPRNAERSKNTAR